MEIKNTTAQEVKIQYKNEDILVVSREHVFGSVPVWNGFKAYNDECKEVLENIAKYFTYCNRPDAENDRSFKQIIPYMVFINDGKLFLMQRGVKGGEKRLANKYSLGIGGHLKKEDIASNDPLLWGIREFQEEIIYSGNYTIKLLGFVNDENTPVGQVHLGMCLALIGDSSDIKIGEDELAWGELVSLDELEKYAPQMETWSQFLFDYLKKQQYYCVI